MMSLDGLTNWFTKKRRQISKCFYSVFSLVAARLRNFKIHYRGPDYYHALFDLYIEFRALQKYSDESATTWTIVYQKFWDILAENEIDITEEV